VADLAITALYTAEAWAWGGFACAELFTSREGRAVFDATNAALSAARLVRRDWAPLRESLVQRHAAIDRIVGEAIAGGARQVIELAAGLSRRGAAVSRDTGVRYVEVDLPAVIARKRALLARSEAGRAVLARTNLALVEGDAGAIDLASIAEDGAVCVVVEGLFMYLDAGAQARLDARVAALRARGDVTLVFDLVPGAEEPPDGALGRAMGGLLARATGGGRFARDARTRGDVLAALAAAGFDDAGAVDTRAVARAWGLPCPDAATRAVVFTARARATRS
jgi:O-methyltransferase involved in polyketide biosynthesis